jgi:acetyl-CoA acetyltransferase
MRDVWIRGVAMTRFGKHLDRSSRDLVEEAVREALLPADLDVRSVQFACVGNAADGLMSGQESSRAQVVLRRTGLLGIPMVTVENGCATGSTALHVAWQAVASGMYDCSVAVGWEKVCHLDRGRGLMALNASTDLTELAEVFGNDLQRRSAFVDLFGNYASGSGRDRFGRESLALVSVKNHQNGAHNPRARYTEALTLDEVLASRTVSGPLTILMCAMLSDGAACVVLSASRPALGPAVRIAASVLTSGRGDDLRRRCAADRAVREATEVAAIGLEDVDVFELHDANSVAELALYEELGMCARGEAERLIRDRVTWLGGRMPVNPSGGLLARGHPMGATGLAQVVELVAQLTGRAGDRQVAGARVGLAENAGGWIGTDAAACGVHVLERV